MHRRNRCGRPTLSLRRRQPWLLWLLPIVVSLVVFHPMTLGFAWLSRLPTPLTSSTRSFPLTQVRGFSRRQQSQKSSRLSATELMGIRNFRGWFESQFGSSLTRLDPNVSDTFDHVVIDLNPLLHTSLLKARSDGQGLTLLFRELNEVCRRLKPTQSLVLAMDGPPGTAKLATQRSRRQKLLNAARSRLQLLETVGAKRLSSKQLAAKRRRLVAESRRLSITPGTDFMAQAEAAILYWAWQSLDAASKTSNAAGGRNGRAAGKPGGGGPNLSPGVRIFLSPSTVPGEGEIKLLEWIYQKPRRGESIAILSGDSDLVLEAWLIPLQSTHNVFVVWPDAKGHGKTKQKLSHACVSVFETTRRLQALVPTVGVADLMRVRTDLVLLLILLGNDYLPKLRGTSGFHKFFGQYVKLHQESSKSNDPPAFLVDPDSLDLDLDVCIDFFQRLAKVSTLRPPKTIPDLSSSGSPALPPRGGGGGGGKSSSKDYLQQLVRLVSAGYVPQPLRFRVVRTTVARSAVTDAAVNGEDDEGVTAARPVAGDDPHCKGDDPPGRVEEVVAEFLVEEDDDEGDEKGEEGENDDGEDNGEDGDVLAGDTGSNSEDENDGENLVQMTLGERGTEEFIVYQVWHPKTAPIKLAKRQLARLALADVMDEDEYSSGGDESDDDIDRDDPWMEFPRAAEANVDSYLYGLLWNIQSYQDGICADYGWNYGRRPAPSAQEIVSYLTEAKSKNQAVGLRQLRMGPFTPPINAGVACLAALPTEVKHLVPEPYRWLADETVEELYGMCVSKEDSSFDSIKFQRLCNDHIAELPRPSAGNDADNDGDAHGHGRRVLLSDHLWTVLSKAPAPLKHPFDPPPPFSDRFTNLRPNNRIRVSKIAAIQAPRGRSVWGDLVEPPHGSEESFLAKASRELNHSQPAPFMMKIESLEAVEFKVAFPEHSKRSTRGIDLNQQMIKLVKTNNVNRQKQVTKTSDAEVLNTSCPSVGSAFPISSDGLTAVACLKQLQDGGLIGDVTWREYTDKANREVTRVVVAAGKSAATAVLQENLEFELVRQGQMKSKKAVKQHLASLVLSEIGRPTVRWSEHTFSDLKRLLLQAHNMKQTN